MTEEERKEITRFICGEAIDGENCYIPDGLYYDRERGKFWCRFETECKRVCSISGKLRKYSVRDMNVLKLSLVSKKLKILRNYLKQHPETINRDAVCECGTTSYSRCRVCRKKVCVKCYKNFDFGVICFECLKDAKEIYEIEEQIEPLKIRINELDKMRKQEVDKKYELRAREQRITDLLNKQKVWGVK